MSPRLPAPRGDFFVVEGARAVKALLQAPRFRVREIRHESGRDGPWAAARDRGVEVVSCTRDEMAESRGYPFHRGVYATVERPPLPGPEEEKLAAAGSIVIPFGLADPGNLGTVIRSAVAFGADAIGLPAGLGADVFNGKCIRSSSAAVFRAHLFEFTEPLRFLESLRMAGFVRFATAGTGDRSLESMKPGRRNAIFFGEEDQGLPGEILENCDATLRIPMPGGFESLNVGASSAIVLYELLGRARGRD